MGTYVHYVKSMAVINTNVDEDCVEAMVEGNDVLSKAALKLPAKMDVALVINYDSMSGRLIQRLSNRISRLGFKRNPLNHDLNITILSFRFRKK